MVRPNFSHAPAALRSSPRGQGTGRDGAELTHAPEAFRVSPSGARRRRRLDGLNAFTRSVSRFARPDTVAGPLSHIAGGIAGLTAGHAGSVAFAHVPAEFRTSPVGQGGSTAVTQTPAALRV